VREIVAPCTKFYFYFLRKPLAQILYFILKMRLTWLHNFWLNLHQYATRLFELLLCFRLLISTKDLFVRDHSIRNAQLNLTAYCTPKYFNCIIIIFGKYWYYNILFQQQIRGMIQNNPEVVYNFNKVCLFNINETYTIKKKNHSALQEI